MHGHMFAYIVVKYVYPIILIVSYDILPFSLPSGNLENDAENLENDAVFTF